MKAKPKSLHFVCCAASFYSYLLRVLIAYPLDTGQQYKLLQPSSTALNFFKLSAFSTCSYCSLYVKKPCHNPGGRCFHSSSVRTAWLISIIESSDMWKLSGKGLTYDFPLRRSYCVSFFCGCEQPPCAIHSVILRCFTLLHNNSSRKLPFDELMLCRRYVDVWVRKNVWFQK